MAKKSKYYESYKKELTRIKRFIRRAEKRGYKFEENVIPKTPKKITQGSVNTLKKLTPEKLYKKSVYGGEQSGGEIVSGVLGRKLERKISAEKAKETRKYKLKHPIQEASNTPTFEVPENISEDESFFDLVVITGFKSHVRQFNEKASNILLSWLDRILQTNDIHDVAKMLNDGAEAGNIVTYQIVYSNEMIYQYMSNMLDYLPEAGTLFKEEIMEAMEEQEDYSMPV